MRIEISCKVCKGLTPHATKDDEFVCLYCTGEVKRPKVHIDKVEEEPQGLWDYISQYLPGGSNE